VNLWTRTRSRSWLPMPFHAILSWSSFPDIHLFSRTRRTGQASVPHTVSSNLPQLFDDFANSESKSKGTNEHELMFELEAGFVLRTASATKPGTRDLVQQQLGYSLWGCCAPTNSYMQPGGVDCAPLSHSYKSLSALHLPSPLHLRLDLNMSSDRGANSLCTKESSQQAVTASSNEDEYAAYIWQKLVVAGD
jgi:hypothetical protein